MDRKFFFAYNVQAIAEVDHIFRHISIEATGWTPDWTAWPLFVSLTNEDFQETFWVAGNDANVCSEDILTPFPGPWKEEGRC